MTPNPEAFNGDWHIEAEVRRLVERYGVKTIVETGTYRGETTRALAGMGAQVVTIEKSPVTDWKYQLELVVLKNVRQLVGDSGEFLKEALPAMRLREPILFYLDAHWGEHSPLLEELKGIAAARLKEKPVIVIHDFLNPEHPEYGFDTWDIGAYGLHLVLAHLDKIYGPGGWAHHYNDQAEGLKRGVIYIEEASLEVIAGR